jgi:hypothetical protein
MAAAQSGTRWAFGIAGMVTAIFCSLRGPLGLEDVRHAHPMAVFTIGLLANISLNILVFAVTLLAALLQAKQVSASTAPEAEKEQRVEEILVPAMQGETPPAPRLWQLVRYPAAASFGVMAGAPVGWGLGAILDAVLQGAAG